MWINEVMSNSIDESYGYNFEWISADAGIVEGIDGVDKDCIVVPSISDVGQFQDNNEYIEIQVTEEEVVSDDWQVAEEEVVSDDWQVSANGGDEDIGYVMEETPEEEVISGIEEPDDYLRLLPYPCNLCSQRFSKKSSLTNHLLNHQLEDNQMCDLCGAEFKRKYELMEHMKIHSYMSSENISLDQSLSRTSTLKTIKVKKKVSKKKVTKKKSKWQTHLLPLTDTTLDTKPIIYLNSLLDLNSGSSSSKLKFDDILIKAESADDEDYNLLDDDDGEKFPIIDPTRPYVCQHCGIGFAREKALISHNMIHAGDSAFECPHCHDMYSSEQSLEMHIVNRHPRVKTQSKKKKLKTPIKKGIEEKFKTFQCEQCDASFTRYNQLKRHQRSVHLKSEHSVKEEVFECDICNLTFRSEDALSVHSELHNTNNELQSCNACGEEYADLNELHSHMKSKHKWGHFCHICGTAYRDAKSLNKHLLTHNDGTHFFPCTVCHRFFHNRNKLKKHMEVDHYGFEGYRCSECGENFIDGASLASHKQSRHSVSRLFPCTQCGKTFTSRSSQQIHIRVHTGEKPYGCRFCWKAFADGGTLRKHERIHTGEKPYVCPVCSKAFNQRVVLREHVRAHHSEGRGRSFQCTVCGEVMGQSRDLVAHLVMHSDENTAKHRLPNTSTRKYSRRKDSSSSARTSRKQQQYHDVSPSSPCK